jgi:ElaB/YqjD/DUF883 family membrane-anchored ribosome-binding protein
MTPSLSNEERADIAGIATSPAQAVQAELLQLVRLLTMTASQHAQHARDRAHDRLSKTYQDKCDECSVDTAEASNWFVAQQPEYVKLLIEMVVLKLSA